MGLLVAKLNTFNWLARFSKLTIELNPWLFRFVSTKK